MDGRGSEAAFARLLYRMARANEVRFEEVANPPGRVVASLDREKCRRFGMTPQL